LNDIKENHSKELFYLKEKQEIKKNIKSTVTEKETLKN
jgi:hypothetical protein